MVVVVNSGISAFRPRRDSPILFRWERRAFYDIGRGMTTAAQVASLGCRALLCFVRMRHCRTAAFNLDRFSAGRVGGGGTGIPSASDNDLVRALMSSGMDLKIRAMVHGDW